MKNKKTLIQNSKQQQTISKKFDEVEEVILILKIYAKIFF